nr:protein ALP1-like [Onthophagus taurus]
MPTPTEDDWKRIAHEFWTIWNFPNCLGALDGKHVVIQTPTNSGSLFFNYKKTFSIVLLALVDAQYNFITVDIGSYGKNSDGGIFAHSTLGRALEQNNLNIPYPVELPGTNQKANFVIVGNEAFPLKPNLLRPYSSPQQRDDTTKKIFNYRLSRARRCSENAFDILAQKFQFYNRRLKSAP